MKDKLLYLTIGLLVGAVAEQSVHFDRVGVTPAYGEPNGAVAWLMNRPVTLFDWGLYRMETRMNDIEFEDALEVRAISSYSWSENRIEVLLVAHAPQAHDIDSAKNVGRKVIEAARRDLGFVDGNYDGVSTSLENVFTFTGYSRGAIPVDIQESLTAITGFKVLVSYDGGMVTCSATLRGTSVMFSR